MAPPQTFGVPAPPQVWPLEQVVAQAIVPPHPSEMVPQSMLARQVTGWQMAPGVTVTMAVAFFVGSAWLVATTWKVPAAAGAT
jgi:hypothetical protein